jgi:hypothetical protein
MEQNMAVVRLTPVDCLALARACEIARRELGRSGQEVVEMYAEALGVAFRACATAGIRWDVLRGDEKREAGELEEYYADLLD